MSEKEEKTNEENVLNRNWISLLLILALFQAMFGTILCAYIQNEWTQSIVKAEYFPNMTEHSSVCDNDNGTEEHSEGYKQVQQVTARWQLTYSMAETVPTFFTQLVLPSYTDAYGRKFLLILSATGTWIKLTILSLTIYFEGSFWFLFASHAVSGLAGSAFGFLAAGFSMVSDLTPAGAKRTMPIVIMECSVMLALVVASFAAGFFVETIKLGFFYSSLIGSCTCTLALLLVIIIPETLAKQKRSKPQSVLKTLKRITELYISSANSKGRRNLYILLLVAFGFANLSGGNRMSMETIYFLGKPFCWGPAKIGIFSMVRSGSQTLAGLVSMKLLQKFLSRESIGILSTLSNAASFIVAAFAQSMVTIYMVPVAAMFSMLITPMIRALMSSMTPVNKQGAMYASMNCVEVICTIIASFTQNAVYSLTMSFMSGFVFLMVAVFSLLNTALMVIIKYMKNKYEISESSGDVEGDKDQDLHIEVHGVGKNKEADVSEQTKM